MIPGIGTDTHVLEVPFKDKMLSVGGLAIGMEHVVIIATSIVFVDCYSDYSATHASASRCKPHRKINSPRTTWAFR